MRRFAPAEQNGNTHMTKYLLTELGRMLPAPLLGRIDNALNYLTVGQWMRANGHSMRRRYKTREQLYDTVGAQVGTRDVLYLEFGVWQGASIRYWSKLLKNPKSKLHGFDSFEGLPEDWLQDRPKGCFSTNGQVPVIDDGRVKFFKGWFDETLRSYEVPSHEVLVINVDADLYSSTATVLNALEPYIVPGTFILFDEFHHRLHELKAFDEFIHHTGMRFKLLGATDSNSTTNTLVALFQRLPA